jgi:4-amino-4-deoxy-L-arabinose transferase-like glycosyltransferase
MTRSAESRPLLRPGGMARRRATVAPIVPGRPALASDRRRRLSRALLAVLTFGVIWRVVTFSAVFPLWGDEAFVANNLLVRGYSGLLRPLDYFQVVPAGFLWAERAVGQVLGFSEWSLRLLPFLAGVASLPLLDRFARRSVDRRSALMAVGILAASMYPLRHSTEMKPYAIDLLISLLTTMSAWSLSKDRGSTARWLALTGVLTVGVWFSYPIVFNAAAVGLFVTALALRSRSPRVLALWALFGLSTASSWLAMYLSVGRAQAGAVSFYAEEQHWGPAFPPLSEPWRMPAWLLDVHTGNMLAYPVGGNHFGSTATFLLVVVGALRLWRVRPALLALLLGPLVPTFLASALHRYPYGTSARVSLSMAPAFCLIAGVGLVELIRRFVPARERGRALDIATIALLVGISGATIVNVVTPYKNFEDAENRRAVRELAGLSRPGETWLVFDGMDGHLPPAGAMREHWPQQLAEVRYHLRTLAPGPLRWIAMPDALLTPAGRRTWLVVHRSGYPRFDEGSLANCLAVLTARLGPPTRHPGPLTRGESLDAYEFPPAGLRQ